MNRKVIVISDYDSSSAKSIENHAKKMEGKSFNDLYDPDKILDVKNKGRLGNLIERVHFGYENNSDEEPDFPDAGNNGVELKVTPVKKIRKSKSSKMLIKREGLSVKERLVIKKINYMQVYDETWEKNSLIKKIDMLLLMFYLYEKELKVIDYVFILISLWKIPEKDMKIIEKDWKTIINKVREGRAHEISEGDTLYLGACTKGASSSQRTQQPFSDEEAKPRAFSLKRSYMDEVFNSLYEGKDASKSLLDKSETSIEDKIKEIFAPYIGHSFYDIDSQFKDKVMPLPFEDELKKSHKKLPKQYLYKIVKKILNVDDESDIEELSKAGVKIKTLRLNSSGVPFEHLSFSAFKYNDIVEENWLESSFYERLENTKYLFVIFKSGFSSINKFRDLSDIDKIKDLIFTGVKLWNMPAKDIEKAKEVWEKMYDILSKGKPIIESVSKSGIRYTSFPSPSENEVSHVRPHGRDKYDTYPLPDTCELDEYTKHSFWLNKSYIAEQIRKESYIE